MTHILCAQNSNSKCSHDESDGKKKQKNQKIDNLKQEANSNSESDKGTKPKHLCSDIESEVSVCMDIALHYSDEDHCV